MGSPTGHASDLAMRTFLTAGVASKPFPCHADKLPDAGEKAPGGEAESRELPRLAELHRQTGVSLAELQALEREGVELEKIPRGRDGGLTSVGSAKHAEGACAPCLFWHRKACVKGLRCTYCHIPHEGLQKKRIRPCKQTRKRLREGKEPILQGRLQEANGVGSKAPGMEIGDSGSEDSSFEAIGGRPKSARTDLPAGIFLDAKGNSRPCWLRDDDPPCYGHVYGCQSGQPGYSAAGTCQNHPPRNAHQYGSQQQCGTQHKYGAQPQHSAQLQYGSQPQYGVQLGCNAPPSVTPCGGYGSNAFPSHSRQH